MIDSWAQRGGRKRVFCRSLFLISLLVLSGACASRQSQPETAPTLPQANIGLVSDLADISIAAQHGAGDR